MPAVLSYSKSVRRIITGHCMRVCCSGSSASAPTARGECDDGKTLPFHCHTFAIFLFGFSCGCMFSLHFVDVSLKTRMLLLHCEPSKYSVHVHLQEHPVLNIQMLLFSFSKTCFQKHVLWIDGITLCSCTPFFSVWIFSHIMQYYICTQDSGLKFELVWITRLSVLCRMWYIHVILQTFLTWRMWLWTLDSDVPIWWWQWWWEWCWFVILCTYCLMQVWWYRGLVAVVECHQYEQGPWKNTNRFGEHFASWFLMMCPLLIWCVLCSMWLYDFWAQPLTIQLLLC